MTVGVTETDEREKICIRYKTCVQNNSLDNFIIINYTVVYKYQPKNVTREISMLSVS